MDSHIEAAQSAAQKETIRFMLSALRIALKAAGNTPARQMGLLGLREQAVHWRRQRLTLGPQPELGDAATEAHKAFREEFALNADALLALLDEFE